MLYGGHSQNARKEQKGFSEGELPNTCDKALGPSHVSDVIVPESIPHHLFFRPEPEGQHQEEYDEARRPRKPVGKQQSLRDRVQKYCRIHWVTDVFVNAVGYQLVAFS